MVGYADICTSVPSKTCSYFMNTSQMHSTTFNSIMGNVTLMQLVLEFYHFAQKRVESEVVPPVRIFIEIFECFPNSHTLYI